MNEDRFIRLQNAKDIIECWRIDYNEGRPHTSFGGLTPGNILQAIGKLYQSDMLQEVIK